MRLVATLRWIGIALGALLLAACATSSQRAHDFALDQIRTHYVDAVPEDRLAQASLETVVAGLDPYSRYLDEAQLRAFLGRTRGEYVGIGAIVGEKAGRVIVTAVMEGGPAQRQGLRVGDAIGVLGEPADVPSILEALRRGATPGSALTLSVERPGSGPFALPLVREVIPEPTVFAGVEPDGIGYVGIASFVARTEEDLAQSLAILQQSAGGRLTGLVLDLRGNPGGLFDVGLQVAACFLDGGVVTSTTGRGSVVEQTYFALPGSDLTHGAPIVVLVDGGSASAAEIVAGALQDHGRAVLIGTRTYGKGSMQTLIPIPGEGALQLTTARFYTPSGRVIQGRGITPDVIVPTIVARPASAGEATPVDHQLAVAMKLVRQMAADRGPRHPSAAGLSPSSARIQIVSGK